MRLLVVASASKADLLDEAFKGISGTYQRVSPSKLRLQVIERLKPDVMIADISNPDTLDNEIVLSGVAGFQYVTIFTELNADDSVGAVRKSILREIKLAIPNLTISEIPSEKVLKEVSELPPIWVIGASSGGPGVLMELFENSTAADTAVVVALHIDKAGFDNYKRLLSEKAQQNEWEIVISSDKPYLKAKTLLLVHPDDEITLGIDGRVQIVPAEDGSKFYPLINKVIRNVSEKASRCGVIILTGIGTDGSGAIRKYKNKISRIIAQDESAPLSSMPDACRKAGGETLSIETISSLINRQA